MKSDLTARSYVLSKSTRGGSGKQLTKSQKPCAKETAGHEFLIHIIGRARLLPAQLFPGVRPTPEATLAPRQRLGCVR
jgi:hypothetical protein